MAGDIFLENLGQVDKAQITITDGRQEQEVKRKYEVQFNPSSLSIKARGGGFIPKLNLSQAAQGTDPPKQDVRITVSFRLVVDQVRVFSAFMEDKLNLSPGQIAQNIAGSIKGKAGKNPNVQQVVEGFISTIRNPKTRNIEFHWGSMHYEGVLNNISAQYVMFDVTGHPIRAYINVSLTCLYTAGKINQFSAYWENAYKDAFSGRSLETQRSGSQLATNLINLG